MLDASEALLLGRGHEVAVDDEGRGGVTVVCVDAEDVHGPGRITLLARVCSDARGVFSDGRDYTCQPISINFFKDQPGD